ncbi:hypothetical protein [Thalassomonas actiniarum]|uniref:Uncharacterized protein n=1 Tax=Thalassomonas actiniarum TaxID=485447 RepID=A0AAE9YU24_9GAMM|nr:hypothetical protein [Thalassomonas actiniarum]WDE00424.1 hypothetical protein SG35_007225 [Thalassomonas actiniarum]
METFEQVLQQAYNDGESDRFISRLRERFDFCQGISQQQRAQHLHYMLEAADAHYLPAQEIVGMVPTEAYMRHLGYQDLPRDEYIKKSRAFHRQKINHLKDAARRGSLKSLGHLAYLYKNQKIPDEKMSLALALAHLDAGLYFTDDNKIYEHFSRQKERLITQASASELAFAEEATQELIQAINQHGSIYPVMDEKHGRKGYY